MSRDDPNPPEWWSIALSLELTDQLKEAEQTIRTAVDHAGAFVQIAHLYELRMQRKLKEGDRTAAIEAYRQSMSWMRFMASGATSGGEGAAYTLQVDQHRSSLVAQLGFDPGDD
jgi:hypothetical protein